MALVRCIILDDKIKRRKELEHLAMKKQVEKKAVAKLRKIP